MSKRPSWDKYFIAIAKTVSTRSHDAETKVGAVLVDRYNRIISTGYNGFPPGCDDNNLPNTRPDKYPYMIHAEMNAIVAAYSDTYGSTLYCTLSPCKDCTKIIIAAGIKRIVYLDKYSNCDFDFIRSFFDKVNVSFEQYKELDDE